jgi:hypothetical protein
MSQHLTRWIEDAEARRFQQDAAFDSRGVVSVHRDDLLGEAIAKVPAWFHALTHVGFTWSRNKG